MPTSTKVSKETIWFTLSTFISFILALIIEGYINDGLISFDFRFLLSFASIILLSNLIYFFVKKRSN